VEICRQAGVNADLAFALKRLGQIERDRQDRDAALRLYQEAADIYRERGDALNLAHTVRHIGDIHQDAGSALLAAPYYEEAVDLYRRLRRQARRGDLRPNPGFVESSQHLARLARP
jgi:tetratricopeptide (TPR) repeat protein